MDKVKINRIFRCVKRLRAIRSSEYCHFTAIFASNSSIWIGIFQLGNTVPTYKMWRKSIYDLEPFFTASILVGTAHPFPVVKNVKIAAPLRANCAHKYISIWDKWHRAHCVCLCGWMCIKIEININKHFGIFIFIDQFSERLSRENNFCLKCLFARCIIQD